MMLGWRRTLWALHASQAMRGRAMLAPMSNDSGAPLSPRVDLAKRSLEQAATIIEHNDLTTGELAQLKEGSDAVAAALAAKTDGGGDGS